jgi:eukaryotic-like serine/threonine-protein kinase
MQRAGDARPGDVLQPHASTFQSDRAPRMSFIRRLIIEAHRRSLWQVLAIFIASGWAVLQALDVLINQGVLPGWVFRAGIALLLLGLPMVLATAFVQEGMPPRGPAPSVTPEMPHTAPRGTPHRLFTWRNAMLGGVGAFALLGFASAGYMGMRTLGIGAPGTLLAQGMIERGAAVVLADFESPSDAELGDVVTRTLRVDLLQSRVIRVLDRADLGAALERMQLERDAHVTVAVATELAEREGYTAVITGNVAPAGSGYVLTANVLGGPGFRQLAGFREIARSDADLVDAIERLSRAIRDKAGESLRDVRSGPALAQVTTTSLAALRAYTRGQEADVAGDYPAALAEYERAVELDSTFAMAYRRIGATILNMGGNLADSRRAVTRAWELRDRLPEVERHIATGYYHYRVSGDLDASTRAYEQALRLDSTGIIGNALGNNLRLLGRYADGAQAYRRALTADAPLAIFVNLAFASFEMGDTAGALAVLDSARVRMPAALTVERVAAQIAVATNDYAAAESAVVRLETLGRTTHERAMAHEYRYLLEAQRGRTTRAERVLAGAPGYMAQPLRLAGLRAFLRLLHGDAAGAVQYVREALAATSAQDAELLEMLTIVAVEAGDARLATELLQRIDSIAPAADVGFVGQLTRQAVRSRVLGLSGRHADAIRLIEDARRRCAGCDFDYDRAVAYDAAGDLPRAIAAYRAMLDRADVRRVYFVIEQPHALRRLAELYDAQGDRASAARYYAQFAELWRDADPELQPQVRAAQQRITELLPDR